MEYGVTAAGFVKKNFADIETEIRQSLENKIGAINLTPSSVFSQIVYSFIDREVDLWNMLEAIYNSFYPDTAEDASLDGVCAITGISRLNATKTTVDCIITGQNNTALLIGTQISTAVTNIILNIDEDSKITTEAIVGAEFEISSLDYTLYSFTIDNIIYQYTKLESDSAVDIANGLILAFADNEDYTISASENLITLVKNTINTQSIFYVSDGIIITKVDSVASFTANDFGDLVVPSFAATTIITPVDGWDFVYNRSAGLTGRNLESDVEFRARRNLSLKLSGSGTIEAMRARLLNITGVTSVIINENATDEIIGSLLARSFEVVILGGDDQEIADMIWLLKPAGISSFGNTSKAVTDSMGRTQNINFSRSVKRYIYANIALTCDSDFNDTSLNLIKSNIVNQINALGTSKDVIYQSLFYPIYAQAGILNAEMVIGGNLTESIPTLSNVNVSIASTEVAFTDTSKITVTKVSG